MPGFGAAKERDADVATELEDVAFERDVSFVGLAGLGIVEAATGGFTLA